MKHYRTKALVACWMWLEAEYRARYNWEPTPVFYLAYYSELVQVLDKFVTDVFNGSEETRNREKAYKEPVAEEDRRLAALEGKDTN